MGGWLEYTREAALSGQVWRLLTASLAHTNADHLLLNVGALMALLVIATRAGQLALRQTDDVFTSAILAGLAKSQNLNFPTARP